MKVVYPPKINNKLNKLFKKFIDKTEIYFEFPPLIKFNLKKRFKKLIKVLERMLKKKIIKLKNLLVTLKN